MKMLNARIMSAAVVSIAGMAATANAQSFLFDWKVNGTKSVSVAPGSVVTITGQVLMTPANPLPGAGYGASLFQVNLMNSNGSDGLNYNEALGLGRSLSLRFTPQTLSDSVLGPMRTISGSTGAVDAFQMPMLFNPIFDASNPINVFSFQFTAGGAGRTVNVDSMILSSTVYSDMNGTPAAYAPSSSGAVISIVPAPGSAALLGLGGVLAMKRRRSK